MAMYEKEALMMNGKIVVSVFIIVIITTFAYYSLVLRPQSFVNPIDPRNEYSDYKVLENTGIESKVSNEPEGIRVTTIESESANIDSYIVIGQIEGINNDELKIRTGERILAIKKPEAIEYRAFPNLPIDETRVQPNDYVRATVSVDKNTNKVLKLSVTVIPV